MGVFFPILVGALVGGINVYMNSLVYVPPTMSITFDNDPKYELLYSFNVKSQGEDVDKILGLMKDIVPANFTEFEDPLALNDYIYANNYQGNTRPYKQQRTITGGILFNYVNLTEKAFTMTLMYNESDSNGSLPKLIQLATQSIQSSLMGGSSTQDVNVKATLSDFQAAEVAATVFLSLGPLLLTYGLTFMMPAFAYQTVLEKEKGLKQQLIMASVPIKIYWTSRFIPDFITYVVIMTINIVVLVACRVPAFVGTAPLAYIILFLCFGLNMIFLSYLLSFIFQKGEAAMKWLGLGISLLIILPYVIVTVAFKDDVSLVVHYAIAILPSYAIFRAISMLGVSVVSRTPLTLTDMGRWSEFGQEINVMIIFLAGEALLFLLLIIATELVLRARTIPVDKSYQQVNVGQFEDLDVANEARRMLKHETDTLRIVNVSKSYQLSKKKVKTVVSNVCLGIPSGECFGLLGPNGAGKTTLIGILSGVVGATSGEVVLHKKNILADRRTAYRSMGVCPQFDSLYDNLTGREHLILYSMLRDLPNKEQLADHNISQFDLLDHADKLVKNYSGGNKRKLSVALAFLGEPKVVFLDEPSTGMDPVTRRKMWSRILELRKNRVIILTTHFMEEADALCGRIGIMINGRLKCLGTPHHLQLRHGGLYRVTITSKSHEIIESFVLSQFPDAKLLNSVGDVQHYEIPQTKYPLSVMFKIMQDNKDKYNISDYSISQTTLEQVFLNFAKQQET